MGSPTLHSARERVVACIFPKPLGRLWWTRCDTRSNRDRQLYDWFVELRWGHQICCVYAGVTNYIWGTVGLS